MKLGVGAGSVATCLCSTRLERDDRNDSTI